MLRQLQLTRSIAGLSAKLESLRARDAEFETRKAALDKREAELEEALSEVTDTTSEEDKKLVDDSITEHEADTAALDKDKADNEADKAKLESEIKKLSDELEEINKKAAPPPKAAEERKEERGMETRTKFFGMTVEARAKFFAHEEVRSFVNSIRDSLKTRSVVNGTLTVPEVMLELLRDNLDQYSKLAQYVNVKRVNGTARQNVMGIDPEGIWMEATGELNELDLSLNQVEVDGYMVGGFIPVSNTLLDDSDIALGTEIVTGLGKAIGKGVDRAIPYGTGVKMPLGIVTRLAQTSQPSDWDANAPAWTDLHTSNIKKLNIGSSTGATFYASLIAALGIAKPNYSDGRCFWIMNRKTHIDLMIKALDFNSNAALVAGVNNQMPVVGGDIIELELVGDYEIIGGYGSVFLMAERAAAAISSSEHVRFLKNQTVFKGYARYDGMPVFGEAFVMVSYDNTDAATTSTFPTDYANTALGALAVTSAAGTNSGDSLVTVTGAESSGTTLGYKIAGKAAVINCGDGKTGYTTLTSPAQVTATTGKVITIVEFDANGRAIKVGSAQVVSKA